MTNLFLFFISLTSLLWPHFSSAKTQTIKAFRPWWSESLFQYETFHSIGNYDSAGRLESLPSSNSFWETSTLDYAHRYVFSRHFAMTAGINYVQVQGNVGQATKYNSGFQTLKGGIEYKLEADFADFLFEGTAGLALFRPNSSSTSPLYGDGAHSLGTNLWILKKMGGLQWLAKAGVLYRTEGLSSLLPYQLGVHWPVGNWLLGAVFDGATSITTDSQDETDRTNYLRRTSVGSLNYRSANPTANFLDLQFKWNATKQFALTGGVGNSLLGYSSADGRRIFVGVDIQWQVYLQPTEPMPFKNAVPKPSKPAIKEADTPLYQEEDLQQDL
jgi:hypothetical protein